MHETAVQPCTFPEAVRNMESCVFCSLIVQYMDDPLASRKEMLESNMICTLGCYKDPRLHVVAHHRCPNNSLCRGDTCPGNAFQQHAVGFVLDRVGPPIDRNSPPAQRGPIRQLKSLTVDYHQIRRWLQESQRRAGREQHVQKEPPSLDSLLHGNRFRVIDVTTSRLVTLKSAQRYVALSYVWGRIQDYYNLAMGSVAHPRTFGFRNRTNDTILNCGSIPSTIRDAIEVVKSLGEKYLWVDSLCINQDDDSDKEAIIYQMDVIYSNAYLTIVAADGMHADCGLYRLRDSTALKEQPVTFTSKGQVIALLSPVAELNLVLPKTAWSQRGWTLQEQVMSRRCLVFTEDEVFYSDQFYCARESYESPNLGCSIDLPHERCITKSHPSFVYEIISEINAWDILKYKYMVQEYTTRALSYKGDRLDAFMAISRQLQPQELSNVHLSALSGLPLESFVPSLCWSADEVEDDQDDLHLPGWSAYEIL